MINEVAKRRRQALTERIVQLAKDASAAHELPTAAILYALAGARCAGSEAELMAVVCKHSERDIARIRASRN